MSFSVGGLSFSPSSFVIAVPVGPSATVPMGFSSFSAFLAGAFAGADITSQTHQSLKNIRAILQAAGLTMDNVVKANVYLKDIGDFAAMNAVYGEYFTGVCPARAAVQVAALPKDALVEIEVIAAE